MVARPEWLSQAPVPEESRQASCLATRCIGREAVAFGRRLLVDASPDFDFDAFFQSQDSKALLLSFGATSVDELFWLIGIGQLSAYAVSSKSRAWICDVIGGAAGMDSRRQLVLDGRPSNGLKYCEGACQYQETTSSSCRRILGGSTSPACSALGAGRSSMSTLSRCGLAMND